jgi:hypothetical protein
MPVFQLSIRTRSHRRVRAADVRWELFAFPEVRRVVELESGLIAVTCSATPDTRAWRRLLEQLGYVVHVIPDGAGDEDQATAA